MRARVPRCRRSPPNSLARSFWLALGLREGVELHRFGATLGINLWPPALKTAFGRLGVLE